MKNQSYFDKKLNLAILQRFAEDWANQLTAIEQISLYICSHEEPAKFALVFSIDEQADSSDLETFTEWQSDSEACTHVRRELADAYYPPLEKGECPMEWICFVEPAGTTDRPCDLIVVESKVTLFERRAAVEWPTHDEEGSDDPPEEFSVEPITDYDPAKRKGFRFNVSLRGQEKEFFKKGWQVLNVLSRYCGEKVPYDAVYRLYTETAAPPDDSSHKSKTKGDKLTFQKLAPSTSGEKEDNTNVGLGTTEKTLQMTDQKTIDDVVKKIEEVKENERALIEDGHPEESEISLKMREDREALEDYLSGNARLTLDEQGETVYRPKSEKSTLAKKKDTLKAAINEAKKEAKAAWPELWQYLEAHLEVKKDFLRLN